MGFNDEGGRLSTLGSRDDDGGTWTKPATTSSMMMVFKDVSGRLKMLVPKCKGGSSTKPVCKPTMIGFHDEDKDPGIKDFQIIGDAKPGGLLKGCGYPVRRTCSCYFQWVRYHKDGIKHYIEGAKTPEYVLTADDVDKFIAVECIPLDENGRQGALVRCFANDQKKISCDPDMQAEIDSYISKGQADFNVLLLSDSCECWKEATFILRHSDFEVKINKTETIQITEKLSDNLSIEIPDCLLTQFVLFRLDGTSHHFMCFNTYNDVRMRDTLVLTIRMFQSKINSELTSLDNGPGIKGSRIIGKAIPGGKLLGCGYPVRGTSLCLFQWVRHLQDGTRHYIEGANSPEYVVTADDVDKCIAVECIPMDENGRQGELVTRFANDQNKISCDPDMQAKIDSYNYKGQADFSVLMLVDSFEHWEEATFILRRSGFQVKINKTGTVQITEKFSDNLSIKIPGGLSAQFVLTCSNGTSHPFRTYNDVRKRDTLVLTIRMFQSKALDDRRKGKGHL